MPVVRGDIAFGDTQNATTNALLTTDDFREVKWSKTLIDYLRTTNDPRLSAIAEIPAGGCYRNNANQALTGDNDGQRFSGACPMATTRRAVPIDISKSVANYPGADRATPATWLPLGNYSRPRLAVYIQRATLPTSC